MLGVDVVDIERMRAALARSPSLEGRLFSPAESAYCRSARDPVESFAGTMAAKEAIIKALRLGTLAGWAARIEIERDSDGVPRAWVQLDSGRRAVEVSIAHDGGVAIAIALDRP